MYTGWLHATCRRFIFRALTISWGTCGTAGLQAQRSALHGVLLCLRISDRSRVSAGVHDTLVNQLLTKIDGVDSLNNILLIGMTNRKDMLDEALLRPGRLEVQVEIGLPDDKGRLQILKVGRCPCLFVAPERMESSMPTQTGTFAYNLVMTLGASCACGTGLHGKYGWVGDTHPSGPARLWATAYGAGRSALHAKG